MNDHCLEKLCTIAAAVGVIGLGMEIGAVAVGVLEGLATTGGLLTMIRATRRGDFQRMLASIKREVEGEYRDWIKAKHGQESWYVLVNIESALAELDGIIDKCVPTPEEVVAVDLNGDRLAERMLEKAAKSSRAYAPDTDNPAAREILRTIVARTFESVRSHPDYAAQLRTYIDEEELKRLGEIKQDTGEIKRDTAEIRAALTALAAPVMCVEDSGKASNPEAFSLVVREGLLIRLRGRVLLHPNFLNKASQQCRNRKLISAITDPAQDLTDNESLVGKLLAYLVIPNLRTKSWSEDELQRVVDEAGHHIHGILLKKAYEVGVFTKNGAMYFVDDDALDSQIYNFAGYLSSNTTRSDIYHNIYKSWKDVITAAVESVPEQDNNYVDILSLFMYSIAYDNGSVCYCGEVCEKWQ